MVIAKDLREEILRKLKTEPLVRISASEAEYLELAKNFPYKIEYHKSKIYASGLASLIHELITGMIITILNNMYSSNENYLVLGSNSGVHIPKFEGGF